MKELYRLTWKEASENAIETIMEQCGVSRSVAENVMKNALIYNPVVDEILGQAMFLLGMDNDIE